LKKNVDKMGRVIELDIFQVIQVAYAQNYPRVITINFNYLAPLFKFVKKTTIILQQLYIYIRGRRR